MKPLRGIVVAVVAALLLTGCVPEPEPKPDPIPTIEPAPPASRVADPLPLKDLPAFSGVVMLNAGSNCTGTLIDTGVPAGPAYVLTNGHCVGDIGRPAQKTLVGEQWWGTATFLRAAGNLEGTYAVEVKELAYSTMRHTDTAIVRLEGTLGRLQDLGFRALPITATEPAEGAAVVNVGVPVQDLDESEWVLRRGECTLGSRHTLIEFFWLWHGVWSNDCPGIIQGSSGSPLMTTDAAGAPTQIVAVINTTSAGAGEFGPCFINHPCQVTPAGAEMVRDVSYAQSAAGIGRCFDAQTGVFSVGGECPLPVSDVWALTGGGAFRGGGLPDAVGALPEVLLSGSVPGTGSEVADAPVRTALAPLGDGTACTDPATYVGTASIVMTVSAEDPWSSALRLPVDLPAVEGRYLLCVVRGEGYEAAASVLFEVDRTPPAVAAAADVEDIGDAVMVRPHLMPPELANVRFTWGAPGAVDCTDTASFQGFMIVPLTIMNEDLPAVYCVYGMDQAGNATGVTEIEIPGR